MSKKNAGGSKVRLHGQRGKRVAFNLAGPFIIVLVIVVVVAMSLVLVSQQRARKRNLIRQSELQSKLDQVEAESRSLENELKDVDSDRYVEKVAREELNMVRPGEIVFESPGITTTPETGDVVTGVR